MKKLMLVTIAAVLYFLSASYRPLLAVDFYDLQKANIVPVQCNEAAPCPQELKGVYGNSCATNYEDFKKTPNTKHYWVEDSDVTAQGQSNERARQFLYWTLSKSAIDNAPVLRQIWQTTESYALFFVVLVAAIFGVGIIVSRRTNFQIKIDIWPTFLRIGLMIVFILFSAAIVLSLIQFSEIIMLFFVENLGGKNLFNIYFANSGSLGGSEANYAAFVGCRDLNLRVQESIGTELLMLKITNFTYYVMGIMIIVRKILLWFMLFIAPFLALLMPFVLIRNVGWIWIGVFFQWLFYGPLFAIFLGALNTIWQSGIPFNFDFSRSNKPNGYVYPTGINITYGGPAQVAGRSIGGLNNGSYVDTFVEYIITLIMLWAVIFFPWLLLRIFRDYCCDGIYAMKNILLAMYGKQGGGGPDKPKSPDMTLPSLKADLQVNKEESVTKNVKISTVEEIRKTQTEDLTKTLNLKMNKLTDIAKMETSSQALTTVRKNLANLANPIKAESSADKQQFMNLRTELFNRAVKQDPLARSMLQSTSTSQAERMRAQRELIKNVGQSVTSASSIGSFATTQMVDSVASSLNTSKAQAEQIVKTYAKSASNQTLGHLSTDLHVSVDKIRNALQEVNQQQQKMVSSVMGAYMSKLSTHENVVQSVAKSTNLSQEQVKSVYNSYAQNINKPINQVVNNISQTTNIEQEKVHDVLQQTYGMVMAKELETSFGTGQKEEKVTKLSSPAAKKAGEEVAEMPKESPTPAPSMQQLHATPLTQSIAEAIMQINKEVAAQEKVGVEDTRQVVQEQLQVASNPEQNIEKAIAIPASVSLEEYEELKQMWTEQYEQGEIPVTENITSRDQWVDQDIVVLTNVMNKILSTDERLQQEGLDDLGYIIPIFMINNMKGDQLVVYLKAKVEAAKSVQKDLVKEKQLRKKFEKEVEQKDADENLVELKKKKPEEKHMEMTLDEDKKERTIEDIGKDVTKSEEESVDPLARIRSTLEEKAS